MICRLAPESALSSDVLIAMSRIDKPNKWPNYYMLYDISEIYCRFYWVRFFYFIEIKIILLSD